MRLELGRSYISYSTERGVLVASGGWTIPCLYAIRRWGLVGKGWFVGVQTRIGEPLYPKKAESDGGPA